MAVKKVLVACGTGGVTSRNIGKKIEDYLKERGMPCKVSTCRILEVRSSVKLVKPDLVVSASELPKLDVPTIRATALLTGVGADEVYEQIYQTLSD